MKAVRRSDKQRGHTRRHDGFNDRWDAMERAEQLAGGSNLRSVWWLAPAQFRDSHFATMPESLAEICVLGGCPKGGTVLDPFGGAGTTGLVADRLQRDAILVELNPEYAEIAQRRLGKDGGMFAEVLAA
jgi:DNA modification methylase